MNRKQFENKLVDKFDEFSPKYEANSKMWENISSELSKKRKRRKAILLPFFILGLSSLFIWQPSFVKENNASDLPFTDSNSRIPSIIHENQSSSAEMEMASIPLKNTSKFTFSNKTNIQSVEQVVKYARVYVSTSSSSTIAIAPVNYNVSYDPSQSGSSQTAIYSTSVERSFDTEVSYSQIKNQGVFVAQLPLLPLQNISFSNEYINRHRLDTFLLSDLQNTDLAISNESQKRSRFSAGFSFGINSLKSSYDLNDQSFASVLDGRMNSERTDLQYYAGLQLEYDLTPKWSIQSGINFYHFQDESFKVSMDTQVDTLENFQRVEQTSTGMDTTILGAAFISNTTKSEFRNYTNRQLLSIPIVLVYNTALSQKSSLGIGLGLENTIFSNIQGVEEDLNGRVYDLSLDSESRYGNRGLYGLMRLMYIYELTSKWDLRLESNLKYELLNNYNTSAPIGKSFHAVGIAISTQLKF